VLVDLGLVEQRYRAVLEVIDGAASVTDGVQRSRVRETTTLRARTLPSVLRLQLVRHPLGVAVTQSKRRYRLGNRPPAELCNYCFGCDIMTDSTLASLALHRLASMLTPYHAGLHSQNSSARGTARELTLPAPGAP
jgi:hypothetical protein